MSVSCICKVNGNIFDVCSKENSSDNAITLDKITNWDIVCFVPICDHNFELFTLLILVQLTY